MIEDAHSSKDDAIFEWHAADEQATETLGAALAGALRPGTVVALVGDLGAGKTRLVQAVATRLGVERRAVSSPTFLLVQEYEGRLPIYHFDTYRLRDSDEFLELGADEMLASNGVCLIEWADRVADVLPSDVLRAEITIAGPSARVFRFSAHGIASRTVLLELQKRLSEP